MANALSEDFFYHPARRVEAEQKMERALYERWGQFGAGENAEKPEPVVGAVHLAAGYLLSEMAGCGVEYFEGEPPRVIQANKNDLSFSADEAMRSEPFKRLEKLMENLKSKYGYLKGDVNWSGVLNLALDVRGQEFFVDMALKPDTVQPFLDEIAKMIVAFTGRIHAETGATSESVNRVARQLNGPLYLHSECSNTMISAQDYEKFILPYDIEWSKARRPFGIHHCGVDPHRFAESYAKVPNLDFLDVGWGGDVKKVRKHLPDTFLNIRLSPVEIVNQPNEELREDIIRLVRDSNDPWLTGVCCINMDKDVADDKITTIYETVEELRREYAA